MEFAAESDALKKAQWPVCDQLATKLAEKGPRASEALESATTSRIHHVRSAALLALAKVNPDRAKACAEKMKGDRAYEVRQTAESVSEKLSEL